MKPFVNAVWADLLIISYAVPDPVLKPYLGSDLAIDRHEGQAYVSVAAFRFRHTRVLGWSAPFPADLCDFPQLNLRTYVRNGEDQGIVFMREFVPSPIVANMVRVCYNEPYEAAKLTCRSTQVGDLRRARYDLNRAGVRNVVAATGRAPACVPEPGALADFFMEQNWGYSRDRAGRLTRFRVVRPAWREYEVEDFHVKLDFAGLFGQSWAFLQDRKPDSVVLFEGSAVEVYANERA